MQSNRYFLNKTKERAQILIETAVKKQLFHLKRGFCMICWLHSGRITALVLRQTINKLFLRNSVKFKMDGFNDQIGRQIQVY